MKKFLLGLCVIALLGACEQQPKYANVKEAVPLSPNCELGASSMEGGILTFTPTGSDKITAIYKVNTQEAANDKLMVYLSAEQACQFLDSPNHQFYMAGNPELDRLEALWQTKYKSLL